MEKLEISLDSEKAAWLRNAVKEGAYASADALIDEALDLWQAQHETLGYTTEELQVLIDEGINSGRSELSMRQVWDNAQARFQPKKAPN